MRLKNTTDIGNKKIQEMVQFVKPKSVDGRKIRIIVQNNRSGDMAAKTDTASWIYVRITPYENKFPMIHDIRGEVHQRNIAHWNDGKMVWKEYKYRKNGGYLPCLVLSREEALVHLLAHEFRHVWQRTHKGKRGKVWGARGRFSERDADAYAIKMQRKWRRRANKSPSSLDHSIHTFHF